MQKTKLLIALLLLILGFAGVLSMLTTEIPIPDDALKLLSTQFSPDQIQWLMLVNPALLVLIAVVVGSLVAYSTGLKLDLFIGLVEGKINAINIRSILQSGVLLGVIIGILLFAIAYLWEPMLPAAFKALNEQIQPSILSRILYGGITEEVTLRFGFMSFILWIVQMMSNSKATWGFWLAILLSSVAFGVGHLPIVYQVIPDPSLMLITYIIVGNSVGGIFLGWLYWKRGLSSAMIAHMTAHCSMLLIANLLG